MLRDLEEELLGRVVEHQDVPVFIRIRCIQLAQHGDHHIVGRFVDERDHNLLTVHLIVPVSIFLHCRLGDFPHKIPGEDIRDGIAEFFQQRLVDKARLRGAHERQCIEISVDIALVQELRDDLLRSRRIEEQLAAAQAEAFIGQQVVQRHHHFRAGFVGGDMVRIGDADVRRRIRGDVGENILINAAVVCIQFQRDRNVRIDRFEVFDRLPVDLHLCFVRIILRPENDLEIPGGVKGLGHFKGDALFRSVTACKKREYEEYREQQAKGFTQFFHPFVPPLETPSMIFLWKIRKRMTSGTEMETTAAIMAGIFSRPKPFSRISWIPLETRK